MAFLGKRPANVVVSGQLLAPGSVTEQNLQSGAVTVQKLAPDVNQAIANATPAGAVAFFAMNTPPAGWVKANGAAVSRTTYASLFAAIGTTYGAGNGSSTFNLPDMRGEFPRGWDDGRGVDSGRGFGSGQGDQNKEHRHDSNTPALFASGSASSWGSSLIAKPNSDGRSSSALAVGVSAFSSYEGGSETRPRNIALLACIKF